MVRLEVHVHAYGTLKGNELSCLKCTVSTRCYDCSSGEFLDYENFDYEDLNESLENENEEVYDDKFVGEFKDIDYEEEWYDDLNMMSADPEIIIPGFVGFVHYGGQFY